MKWVTLILNLLPLALKAVEIAEAFFGKGNGAAKKEFVMDVVSAARTATSEEEAMAVLAGRVDTAVGLANQTGVFATSK